MHELYTALFYKTMQIMNTNIILVYRAGYVRSNSSMETSHFVKFHGHGSLTSKILCTTIKIRFMVRGTHFDIKSMKYSSIWGESLLGLLRAYKLPIPLKSIFLMIWW